MCVLRCAAEESDVDAKYRVTVCNVSSAVVWTKFHRRVLANWMLSLKRLMGPTTLQWFQSILSQLHAAGWLAGLIRSEWAVSAREAGRASESVEDFAAHHRRHCLGQNLISQSQKSIADSLVRSKFSRHARRRPCQAARPRPFLEPGSSNRQVSSPPHPTWQSAHSPGACPTVRSLPELTGSLDHVVTAAVSGHVALRVGELQRCLLPADGHASSQTNR